MRFAIVALSTLLAGIVSAQTGTSIPTCAQSCVTSSLPSSCNLDPTCICNTKSFISGISCCIYQQCDPADQQAALAYAHTICDPVGASSLLPVSAGCTANSTAASTAGSSNSTMTGTGAVASVSASASSALSSISSAASSVSASLSSAASGASQTASAAATSSSSSPAAGGRLSVQGVGMGAVGAAFLGLAALL